jgi:hypothetical protein
VAPDLVLDLRDEQPVDLRDTDLQAADEPTGRHER